MPTLELIGITKDYGHVTVLDNVSMTVEGGRVRAVVGENGAGKSTLLKIISGVVAPTSGEMRLRGEPVRFDRLDPERAQRLGVAVVHQEFSLLPAMTVAENVFLGREPRRGWLVDRKRMVEETEELLDRLAANSIDPERRVDTLGVAGVQIVEIAKALSIAADVVAMDEPSAVLSGAELEQLFTVVRALKAEGVAVLYVSHRLDEVFELCDDYTVLKDGRVSGDGQIGDIDRNGLVQRMVGREVSQVFPRPLRAPGETRLSVRGLQVTSLPAPVDLDLRAGEIVGIAGLNGAGRTRLVKGLFGALPAMGRITIDGTSRAAFSEPAEAIRAGVAFIPEDRKVEGLALQKSIRWNLSLNALRRLTSGGFLSPSAEKRFAADQIEAHDVRTTADGATAGSLSGGNQQKVVLSKWLANDPAVIMLDEPTRGIDVGSKEQIYALLRSLAERGAAVLVISSELIEVLGLSDRVLVMADGRIVAELAHDEATEERVLEIITASSSAQIDARSEVELDVQVEVEP